MESNTYWVDALMSQGFSRDGEDTYSNHNCKIQFFCNGVLINDTIYLCYDDLEAILKVQSWISPTSKQMNYAWKIASTLEVSLPEIQTKKSVAEFIDKYHEEVQAIWEIQRIEKNKENDILFKVQESEIE